MSNKKDWEWNRRAVHAVFGFGALLLAVADRWPLAAVAAAAVVYNAVLAPRMGWDRGYRRGRMDLGLVTYPLAVLLLILLTPAAVAAGAWVVLAAADPVAGIAGTRWPRPRVPWQKRKSMVGAAVGFLVGAIACWGIGVWMSAHGRGLSNPALAAVGAAAAGALAETLPVPRDDNLVVAVAAAAALIPWVA